MTKETGCDRGSVATALKLWTSLLFGVKAAFAVGILKSQQKHLLKYAVFQ